MTMMMFIAFMPESNKTSKKPLTLIFAILGAFFIGLCITLFFNRDQTPKTASDSTIAPFEDASSLSSSKSKTNETQTDNRTITDTKTSVASQSPSPSPPVELVALTPKAIDEIKKCFGKDPETTHLDTFIRNQLNGKNGQIGNRIMMNRVIHFRTLSGETHRIRISPDDSPNDIEPSQNLKQNFRLQMFYEDDEGLPMPLPVPKSMRMNPTEEMIHTLTKEGQVTLEETAMITELQGDKTIETIEQNNQFIDAHITTPQGELGCNLDDSGRNAQCKCLSSE
jgi:hypothetical protein